MHYNYYKKAGLLVLENEGKKSLYRFTQKNTNNVKPIAKLSNQTRLEIYPDDNLIVADSQILTLNLKPIHNCESYHEVTLFAMDENYVLIKISAKQFCLLLFWSKKKVTKIVNNCLDVRINSHYAVVKKDNQNDVTSPVWQVYAACGAFLNFAGRNRIYADNVQLKEHFLITDGMANHNLYWLPSKEVIIKEQQRIVIGKNFALCGDISGLVQLYRQGRWKKFNHVENFGTVAEKLDIFYLQYGGKYHLYCNDGSPFLQGIYPEGFDAVSYNAQSKTLLLMIGNHVKFYL